MSTVRVIALDDDLRAQLQGDTAPDWDRVTLASAGPLPLDDLRDSGWLGRLTALSGAPVVLDPVYVVRAWPGALELDAFALATIYGAVVWDDRAYYWHRDSGRPDSAPLLRTLHDLAMRAWRNHGEGERLVIVLEH